MSAEVPPLRVFTARSWPIVRGEPNQVAHAAATDSNITLCGLQVATLVEFPDYVYTELRPSLRCEECDEAVKEGWGPPPPPDG